MSEKLKFITREEWAAALESGNYKQARNHLSNERTGGFCCLGVAADLCGVDWDKARRRNMNDDLNIDWPEIAEMLRLEPAEEQKLIAANDGGTRFKTIAKMVRARP